MMVFREQEKAHPSMYTTVSSPDINIAAGISRETVDPQPRNSPRVRSHSSRGRHRVKRVKSEHID